MNIPLLGWGMWDYKGAVRVGRSNTRVGFGSMKRPTNFFNFSEKDVARLVSDPRWNELRGLLFGIDFRFNNLLLDQTYSIPVNVFPGNFVPLRCKPPFCNPYLSNLAWGVDVEPGDDALFDGGLDFPVPLAPGGIGLRIPLSGAVNAGTDPLLITYGHGLGPTDEAFENTRGNRGKNRRGNSGNNRRI